MYLWVQHKIIAKLDRSRTICFYPKKVQENNLIKVTFAGHCISNAMCMEKRIALIHFNLTKSLHKQTLRIFNLPKDLSNGHLNWKQIRVRDTQCFLYFLGDFHWNFNLCHVGNSGKMAKNLSFGFWLKLLQRACFNPLQRPVVKDSTLL